MPCLYHLTTVKINAIMCSFSTSRKRSEVSKVYTTSFHESDIPPFQSSSSLRPYMLCLTGHLSSLHHAG